jgi:hypothetical protein
VCCGTPALTQQVAELVGGFFYHSKVDCASEKAAAILKRQEEEKDKVFAVTNVLGLRVGAARIPAVRRLRTMRRTAAGGAGRALEQGLAGVSRPWGRAASRSWSLGIMGEDLERLDLSKRPASLVLQGHSFYGAWHDRGGKTVREGWRYFALGFRYFAQRGNFAQIL